MHFPRPLGCITFPRQVLKRHSFHVWWPDLLLRLAVDSHQSLLDRLLPPGATDGRPSRADEGVESRPLARRGDGILEQLIGTAAAGSDAICLWEAASLTAGEERRRPTAGGA